MTVRICIRSASAAILTLLSLPTHAQSVREASELLQQGKSRAAYELLAGEESRYAGNAEFDYLLGRAALDAGEPSKATLIFERVLAVSPNHAGARLDMGRAYFALGDFPRAKIEFESLQALNPPPAAQATIAQYLEAIREHGKPAGGSRLTAYVEAGYGRDSNVTVGPRSNTIYFPVFNQSFLVSAAGQARGANFHQVNAGAELTHPLDDNNAFFVGTDLRTRNFSELNSYNQTEGDVRAGWIHKRDKDTFRLAANFGNLHLGNDRYRQVTSFGGDWRHQADNRHQIGVFAQTSEVRYLAPFTQINNNHLHVAGVVWVMQPTLPRQPLISASAFIGREQEDAERSDGSKSVYGIRSAMMLGLNSAVDVYGSATFQYGDYSRRNFIFSDRRNDRQYDLSLGVNWRFSPGWSLRPQISWTRNDSNFDIYTYDRTEGSLMLRKDF